MAVGQPLRIKVQQLPIVGDRHGCEKAAPVVKVRIICLRKEGKQIPKWQLGRLEISSGELRIEEARNEYLSRFMRSARLLDHALERPDALPPLIDAAVLWLKHSSMAITGFENVDGVDYAQTWRRLRPDLAHTVID
jgi:hypothetical protein